MDNNAFVDPRPMPLHFLMEITNGFSTDHKVREGSYGTVYKGEQKNGETIAVKLLHEIPGLDAEQFEKEYHNLASLQHKNVVRLVGYCDETRREVVHFNGKIVFAEVTKRALCFQYTHNGGLDNYLSDEFCGHDWPRRYAIIKGICQGLKYLHEELHPPMYHLDLKPENILLDENMDPKIADFGLSRLFGGQKTQMSTSSIGTLAYIPPEYIDAGIISNKYDVFSLGVVIVRIMTGPTGYYRSVEMSSQEFIERVHANWRKRLNTASVYLQDSHSGQVKRCIEIALSCLEGDRHKRPSIGLIVNMLNETETLMKSPYKDIGTSAYKKSQLSHLSYLKDITNNFSEERILGQGGSGVVYKGELQNGEVIAVKKVETMCVSKELCEKSKNLFENEVTLLLGLKHPNVVQLLDYCYEMKHDHLLYGGKFCWQIDTLLCLEFLPEGSLDNHISDATSGLDWCTRYKTIEGISYGLQYLHEQPDAPIIHLDLKPANILFDANMVPKIADFGISRIFDQGKTIHTLSSAGTPGYMPPEYILRGPVPVTRDTIRRGIITPMSDIFSLGVIIMEIITGLKEYPYDINEDSSKEYINTELGKWRTRLEKGPGKKNLQTYCEQIGKCIQIGLMCVNSDRTKRPTIRKITNMLQGLETTD